MIFGKKENANPHSQDSANKFFNLARSNDQIS